MGLEGEALKNMVDVAGPRFRVLGFRVQQMSKLNVAITSRCI